MNFPRILIIAPAWVGDMVMAQSLFMTLKQHHPECQLDVLAPNWTRPLVTRMPQVTEALSMPELQRGELGLKKRYQLGKSLRSSSYNQAILLPNTWKSALIPWSAKIPQRTGYLGECRWGLVNDIHPLDKKVLTKTVQRFVALAFPQVPHTVACPFPALQVSAENQQQVIEKYALNLDRQILALCPGAEYGAAKRWPVAHYAAVAQTKLQHGWQVWLLGSAKDAPITAAINTLTRNACADFAGKTSLTDAVDLLSLSDAVISNDSGLMHVAAALDKKLIALYGSSDPQFTPPLSSHAKILRLDLACSPCFQRDCPLGGTPCLTQIMPEKVLAALAAVV